MRLVIAEEKIDYIKLKNEQLIVWCLWICQSIVYQRSFVIKSVIYLFRWNQWLALTSYKWLNVLEQYIWSIDYSYPYDLNALIMTRLCRPIFNLYIIYLTSGIDSIHRSDSICRISSKTHVFRPTMLVRLAAVWNIEWNATRGYDLNRFSSGKRFFVRVIT